jgi:homoserine kinase type II
MTAVRASAAELLAVWGVPADADLASPAHGYNNQTLVVTQRDRRWVLRISQNLSVAQVQAEHRLLARLRPGGLPFAVPEPVPTLAGGTVAETAAGPATLCRWIAGVRPDLEGRRALERFGAGVGVLSEAMRLLPLDDAPQDWRAGPLATLPVGVELAELVAELRLAGVGTEQAGLLAASAERARAWQQDAAGRLAIQVVHGDLGASNVLVDEESGQVTGVLDFEIAGADFRVQDLVAALLLSGALRGPDWHARAAALIRGIVSVLRLGEAEIQAVPELLICRSVGSAIWRAARWRRGLAGIDDVIDRLRELAATVAFVAASGEQLRALLTGEGTVTRYRTMCTIMHKPL